MKVKNSIGIIGLGFVGSACYSAFSKKYLINTYDIKVKTNCSSIDELVSKSNIVFVCVPTPMDKDGSTDLSIIYDVFSTISACENLKNKYFCIKSTIPIGTCDKLSEKFSNSNIIFNPEFLTERNAIADFKNQNRIILSGSQKSVEIIAKFYKTIFSNIPIIKTDYKTAELVKYFTNSFLATKVSFANEIYDLCNTLNIDYSNLKNIALHDQRLGHSHFDVPGHDGERGFSGSCFPKDLNSLLHQYKTLKVDSPILKSVWDRNLNIDKKNQD
jgi:nucleotide sugar dehydrogenase